MKRTVLSGRWSVAGIWMLLLACLPVPAQSVYMTPVIRDPLFGGFHLVYAEQLASNVCTVLAKLDSDPWYEAAGYGCYFETQFVVATVPNRGTIGIVRSLNNYCGSPAGMLELEAPIEPLTPALAAHRFTIRGVSYRLEPLAEPLFGPQQARRFRAVRTTQE